MTSTPIPTPLAARLGPLIGKLGSPHDGEVIAAARAMGRLMERHRIGFNDLANVLMKGNGEATRRDHRAAPSFADYASAARWLAERGGILLTDRDREFVSNMARILARAGAEPSEKQAAWLRGLVERCGGLWHGR